jgi:uncharacterized Zn finger protein (UPF0148 family)
MEGKSVICPKCVFQQEGTSLCDACGIYFEKYKKMQERMEKEKSNVQTSISRS